MNERRPQEPRLWRYELGGGFVAFAGKTDADNDRLSLRIAKANDYWFHVRGMPGSHVVLVVDDVEPERDIVKAAAAIAAYHSKARSGGSVAVTCARAKNVSKPKGAKAGTVTVRKESVIKVKPALPSVP